MNKTTKLLAGTLIATAIYVLSGRYNTATPAVEQKKTVSADSILKVEVLSDAALGGGKSQLIPLKREAYSVLYNPSTRLPVWVAWRLTAEHTDGPYSREGKKFAEDMDVPKPRAVNLDYVNSGYDRGHLCPSGDNKWSEKAQTESFLYTNCCPQLHNLNSGDWNELESRCRYWAKQYGEIYIVSGPVLLNKKHKTIGKNKIVVPEAFFKVVLCMSGEPKAIGFIYRNERTDKKMASYVNTVDDVERITGLDFFTGLPDDVESKVESAANVCDWDMAEK